MRTFPWTEHVKDNNGRSLYQAFIDALPAGVSFIQLSSDQKTLFETSPIFEVKILILAKEGRKRKYFQHDFSFFVIYIYIYIYIYINGLYKYILYGMNEFPKVKENEIKN